MLLSFFGSSDIQVTDRCFFFVWITPILLGFKPKSCSHNGHKHHHHSDSEKLTSVSACAFLLHNRAKIAVVPSTRDETLAAPRANIDQKPLNLPTKQPADTVQYTRAISTLRTAPHHHGNWTDAPSRHRSMPSVLCLRRKLVAILAKRKGHHSSYGR